VVVSTSEVVWHDLECGSYRADLPLWRELAERSGRQDILEIGAGTGRVALELTRAGNRVTALDHDPHLLAALRERAGGADIETVCADARTFELARHDYGLCLVPMQTVQLFGGSAGRIAFLRRARAHLRPGGLLACAIVADFEQFDRDDGDNPPPDAARVDGALYVSAPRRVWVTARTVKIERERRVLPLLASDEGAPAERVLTTLDRLGRARLRSEGVRAGLRPEPSREVPATEEHVGSAVVMFRA
jgi:SAM-dependent methyltransferase